MSGWTQVGAFAALTIWAAFASTRWEGHFQRWFLRRGRNQVSSTIRWVVLVNLAWLLGWAAIAAVGLVSGEVARWLVLPMVAAHLPVLLCFGPGRLPAIRTSMREFEERGADRRVARSLYLVGFPFFVVGLAVCCTAFIALAFS